MNANEISNSGPVNLLCYGLPLVIISVAANGAENPDRIRGFTYAVIISAFTMGLKREDRLPIDTLCALAAGILASSSGWIMSRDETVTAFITSVAAGVATGFIKNDPIKTALTAAAVLGFSAASCGIARASSIAGLACLPVFSALLTSRLRA